MKTFPLFFSGGTALRELAEELSARKIYSSHVITTFDSGGSTAQLRKSFAMPAIGDLRNRLLALADRQKIEPPVLEFLDSRLPMEISRVEAQNQLAAMVASHAAWTKLPAEFANLFRHCLRIFRERMPGSFDARGASLGNLIMTGAFLENRRDLVAVISLFSAILHICGSVLPISDANLHLGACLQSGQIIISQEKFHNLPAPIQKIFLTVCSNAKEEAPIACSPPPFAGVTEEIARAGLICLPVGSFFSSVLPHLLLPGIGQAILASSAPKIFIPNSGMDRELLNVTLFEQVSHIRRLLARDAPGANLAATPAFILVDRVNGRYNVPDWDKLDYDLAALGIKLIDLPVVDPANPQRHLPRPLLDALIKIAGTASAYAPD